MPQQTFSASQQRKNQINRSHANRMAANQSEQTAATGRQFSMTYGGPSMSNASPDKSGRRYMGRSVGANKQLNQAPIKGRQPRPMTTHMRGRKLNGQGRQSE